ncbi:unnamed protein product [Amoebophrya sp. A25]|nr:unnamed protein product [Amoebophrya sp. A25]|eukprot:GSA25T00000860001.1
MLWPKEQTILILDNKVRGGVNRLKLMKFFSAELVITWKKMKLQYNRDFLAWLMLGAKM